MLFDYICIDCGLIIPKDHDSMICPLCGGEIRGKSVCSIVTEDTFGKKNIFTDDKTGKRISSWKSWEKAGFRDPLQTPGESNIKAGIKRKIDKIKFDQKKKFSVSMGTGKKEVKNG